MEHSEEIRLKLEKTDAALARLIAERLELASSLGREAAGEAGQPHGAA